MNSKKVILIMFSILLCNLYSKDLKSYAVENFDLKKYLGTWYEIARLPNSFEKDLIKVTATYSLKNDGKVEVLNKGYKNGKYSTAEGKAKFADKKDKGHLKVSFFWIFYADYIVAELASDYSYALVTGGSHKYLWILSRTTSLDNEIVDDLLSKAEEMGFDTKKVVFVEQ